MCAYTTNKIKLFARKRKIHYVAFIIIVMKRYPCRRIIVTSFIAAIVFCHLANKIVNVVRAIVSNTVFHFATYASLRCENTLIH